ncbi:Fatty acid desaturase [Aquisphaera giovannonii]|uniref:Fatty acid desaturase n=1 Tax=Aquisphaera giovannonii TaxID=406548 RepID=A0A5B9VTE7_9BACT|nr:fatty acid desaturase [Aquisphaera giovannonii]QEH31776.1 Fatty acid desaturase [Aquisphaera giovannonii]
MEPSPEPSGGVRVSPALRSEVMKLRRADNVSNLGYLAMEYLSLAAVIGGAVAFAESRERWGLAWSWNVPVFAIALVLVGAIQHRLAGLGHEAAHYTFMRNRFLNDLIPDLFCMFPLLTATHFYRVFHMAHHQFTNDPGRDPDILNLGHGKRFDEFPMSRARFVRVIYFGFLVAPVRFLRYQWAYIEVNTLGQGKNAYYDRSGGGRARLGTLLGLAYVFGINAAYWALTLSDRPRWLAPAGLIGIGLAAAGIYGLPGRIHFRSPLRSIYSVRFASLIRLGYYTLTLGLLAHLRWATAGASVPYVFLLWFLPMGTSFMFFMFLRDVYQHSNADAGRLTNSRVFHADPFTRWAVFVYGQDMHIPHHLYPAIPHYRLRRLHELLRREDPAYRERVVETHGTFRDPAGRRTILDELTGPRAAT